MKTAVKYGIYISLAVIVLKLALAIPNLELQYARAELAGMLMLFLAGLILSIRASQQKEYNGAGLSTELLKEGLITSAVFALLFSVFSLVMKFIEHDLPPSLLQLIFGLVFFFIFITIVGGLFSVFISYTLSKRKAG